MPGPREQQRQSLRPHAYITVVPTDLQAVHSLPSALLGQVSCVQLEPLRAGAGPDCMPGAGTHKALGSDPTHQVKTHLSMKRLATWGEGRGNQRCCLLRTVTVLGVMGSRAESQTRLPRGHPPFGALLWVQGEPQTARVSVQCRH